MLRFDFSRTEIEGFSGSAKVNTLPSLSEGFEPQHTDAFLKLQYSAITLVSFTKIKNRAGGNGKMIKKISR